MTNFSLFSLLLFGMRGLTIPFCSINLIFFIFVSTFIITYVSLLVSKKIGYLNSYLNILNYIINLINIILVVATSLIILNLYINYFYIFFI